MTAKPTREELLAAIVEWHLAKIDMLESKRGTVLREAQGWARAEVANSRLDIIARVALEKGDADGGEK